MADSSIVELDVVAPVEIRVKNRQTTRRAMVLPGESEPLLGAIPLEDMPAPQHFINKQILRGMY